MPTLPPESILDHLYRAPQKQGDGLPPALFLIHGYGSNKEDLFSFANYLPGTFGVVALNAPIRLPFGGYAWYELQFTAGMERLSNLDQARTSLDLLQQNCSYYCEKYGLDTKQVTFLGFSQGAILSWALALDAPACVQRVIGLSGVIDPDLIKRPLASYRNITAFASHGTQDATIPIHYSRETVVPLQENNPHVTYKEYPSGHTIDPNNFQDMLAWIHTYSAKG
ncbi:MAG: alpha/beta hydrolase [Flavobacteriaceae bacterium]